MISLALGLGVNMGGSSSGFPISSLFAAGEQGGWYDPSDFTTMFQDTAGTSPVTAVGQSVARVNDKSGRGNTIVQATAGSRPILQQDGSGFYYLAFDGLDDAMATTATVNYTATAQVTICAGVRKEFDQSGSFILEHTGGATVGNSGGFGIDSNGYVANGAWLGGAVCGTASTASAADSAAATMGSPVLAVVTLQGDTAGATIATEIILRKNGTVLGYGATSASNASGNFATATTYVGGRGGLSLFFTGRMYQIVVRGAATSGASLTGLEQAVNAKCGAF